MCFCKGLSAHCCVCRLKSQTKATSYFPTEHSWLCKEFLFFLSFYSSHKLLENQNGKSDSSYRLLKQIQLSACRVTPAPKARLLGPSACSISQNKLLLTVVVQEDPFECTLQELTLLLAFLGLLLHLNLRCSIA